MLQRQHHLPRWPAIGQGGTCPVIGGGIGKTGATFGRSIDFVRQGIAATGALWGPQEMELPEAARAEAIIAVDDLAAAWAARRQHQIECSPEGCGKNGQDCRGHC